MTYAEKALIAASLSGGVVFEFEMSRKKVIIGAGLLGVAYSE